MRINEISRNVHAVPLHDSAQRKQSACCLPRIFINAIANNFFILIPNCIALGEAAGIAAAQSINSGVGLRKIDIRALQASFKKQGAILPA